MTGYRNDYYDKNGKHVKASFHPFKTRSMECYERGAGRQPVHTRIPGAVEAANAGTAGGLRVETARIRLRVSGGALFIALNRHAAHGNPEMNRS